MVEVRSSPRPVPKVCSRCGQSKPRSEFHKNASRKDGLQHECKECHGQSVSKYRGTLEYMEYQREYQADYRKGIKRKRTVWQKADIKG